MVDTAVFTEKILEKIHFFAGIPDSLLKDFNAYIGCKCDKNSHVITANEGSAVALATGYYLSTGKIPLVYMQNSGIGNALNPLVSLADKYVYSIPMILVIGWRGFPGIKDEPQHLKQGAITLKLLEIMDIPFAVLPDETDKAIECFHWAYNTAKQTLSACAIVVKQSTFSHFDSPVKANPYTIKREEAIKTIINLLMNNSKYKVFATTGMISRELFEIMKQSNNGHKNEFLAVGSMGHISQIALVYAINHREEKVVCLDGDGSFLMHMGNAAIAGTSNVDNFIHIVLNNCSHDSVGGQPTVADKIDICGIAKACGYNNAFVCKDMEELEEKLTSVLDFKGKFLLEVKVSKGARKDLGRPSMTAKEIKENFMRGIL